MGDAGRIKELEGDVERLTAERDEWEKKYEEADAKWRKSQADLAELEATMQDL